MRFNVVNLGCRVNRVESDSIMAALEGRGMVRDAGHPDVVVVNTCTVTGEAQKKTRKAVRHVLRCHPDAVVVVTGCAAAISPEEFTQMSSRVRISGKAAVVDVVGALDESAVHGHLESPEPLRVGEGYPTRVGVKIQDGCDNACTFCIVHVARGTSTSRPEQECLDEVGRLYRAGVREVVLTGIDLGNYHCGQTDVTMLLRKMVQLAPEARFRLSSIEPPSVTPQLAELMEQHAGRICRHLHMPLQSGSSKVLSQMNRHYTAEEYLELVGSLYERMPQLSLSTDIIVGFPGETDDDFQQTLEMVRKCRFTKVHAFRYSKRAGTPAAARPDQVDPQVMADRAAELARVSAEVRLLEQGNRVGTRELLLVEKAGLATTESYFTARVPHRLPVGELVRCTLTELDKDGIFIV